MTVLQAPIDLSQATRQGPRLYRKQLLAKRGIDYPLPDGTKRHVEFDDEYLTDLAAAFSDGAYDLVPFQLANAANQHNEDPRNYGGRLIGVEVTPDGLDGILELSEDAAELVEKTGRRLGVSARIKEALEHVDGRTFKRAVRHVLGTLDGRMAGLREWEPIDLSAETDPEVIDLTGYTDQEGSPMPRGRFIDLSTLSDEAAEALESYAALNGIDLADPEVDPDDEPDTGRGAVSADDEGDEPEGDDEEPEDEEPGDDEGDEPADETDDGITDEELEALLDAELEASGVELSAPVDDDTLDLAEHGTDGDERQAERRELAETRFKLTSQEYARKGVPPHLIDLAEPILSLTEAQADTLDLSSPATGESIDVRGIVRDMLDAVAGTIDLSGEAGYGHETEPDQQVTDLAGRWSEYLENN